MVMNAESVRKNLYVNVNNQAKIKPKNLTPLMLRPSQFNIASNKTLARAYTSVLHFLEFGLEFGFKTSTDSATAVETPKTKSAASSGDIAAPTPPSSSEKPPQKGEDLKEAFKTTLKFFKHPLIAAPIIGTFSTIPMVIAFGQTYGAVVTAITGFTVGSTSFLISLFALGTALGLIGGGAYLGVKAILAGRTNKSNRNNGTNNNLHEANNPIDIALNRSANKNNYENTPDGLYMALTDLSTLKDIKDKDKGKDKTQKIAAAIFQINSYANTIRLDTYKEKSLHNVATARNDLAKFTNLTNKSQAAREVQAHIKTKLEDLERRHNLRYTIECTFSEDKASVQTEILIETEEGFEKMTKEELEEYIDQPVDKDGKRRKELECPVGKLAGEGANSEVYVASVPKKSNKIIALKITKKEYTKGGDIGKQIVSRAWAEGKAMKKARDAQISNVLTIYGQTRKEQPVLALEYMKTSLEDKLNSIDGSSFNVTQSVEIIKQILLGLKELAEIRIHHRDLKPGNIFLEYNRATKKYSVKIADFGWAKMLEMENMPLEGTRQREIDKTAMGFPEGVIFGTLRYLDPAFSLYNYIDLRERLETKHPEFKALSLTQSDLYAVGVIFYRLLTSRFPVNIAVET
ncbi:MAG: protein kinase, partial [Candidatus Margulisbacteria bacterium]|nr:protein kinase [Candidatus Margulisiibacteriota bacterium]